MYLSQMILNSRSRKVWHEHRTLYQTHRTILHAFPEVLPPDERVLFRREELPEEAAIRLLIQSVYAPDWSALADRPGDYFIKPPESKSFTPRFETGQYLAFRLLANPTVKRNGKRLGLFQEDDQLGWLLRKGEAGGFTTNTANVRIIDHGFVRGKTGGDQTASLYAVQFDGLLGVTAPEQFQDTLCNGIGSGKGMGFGLLTVARPEWR